MLRYIKARKGFFCLTFFTVVLFNVLSMGSSVLEQRLIDGVSALDMGVVSVYVPVLIVYSLFYGGAYVLTNVCQEFFVDKIMNDVRCGVFSGIMRRNKTDFAAVNTADYISAITNDIRTINSQYLSMLLFVAFWIVCMVCSAALMLYYQPVVALFALLLSCAITIAPVLLSKEMQKWQKLKSERLAKLTTCLSEFFAGFDVIASFGIKKHIEKRFQECSDALKSSEYRADGMDALSGALAQFLSALAQTLILALSCCMVLKGRMSFGALVIFESLNSSFCGGLSMVLRGVPLMKEVKPVVDRVNALADYTDDTSWGTETPTLEAGIQVTGLYFGYSPDTPVLRDLSMELARGGKYALVGESGSGKSTLIRLLAGDHNGYQGSICYDGKELHTLDREKLHQITSVIHQDVFLFDDTIRNNICLFEEFTQEQFDNAIKQSGVKHFLDEIPEGAEYNVGERGTRLSGGQRQRVAIARALIRGTGFLILDEGTSSLDAQNALEIESALLSIPQLTLLSVTHHLKNEQDYDAVFEMRNGCLCPRCAGSKQQSLSSVK